MGATEEQVLGELEFVEYLAARGVPVARPVASRGGKLVETIPVGAEECFLVDCFEKAPGFMYPDEDEVLFPEEVLAEWGRTAARMHRLAAGFLPSRPGRRRPSWDGDDLLDFEALLPPEEGLARRRYAELIAALRSLPRDEGRYGLVHGDLHHGNFFVEGGKLIVFDFDACRYSWFLAETCLALDNCLPPTSFGEEARRDYALRFLRFYLRGYREEMELPGDWVETLPLFLRYCDLLRYSYCRKYLDMGALSPARAASLARLRSRIEEGRPSLLLPEGLLRQD
jgi:amicoumacin kinase